MRNLKYRWRSGMTIRLPHVSLQAASAASTAKVPNGGDKRTLELPLEPDVATGRQAG